MKKAILMLLVAGSMVACSQSTDDTRNNENPGVGTYETETEINTNDQLSNPGMQSDTATTPRMQNDTTGMGTGTGTTNTTGGGTQ